MDLKNCIKLKACTEAAKENGLKLPCETCKHFIPRPKSELGLNNKMEKKMSNKLTDLNEHLFTQLDRLSKSASADELSNEITRSQAMGELIKLNQNNYRGMPADLKPSVFVLSKLQAQISQKRKDGR